jgi:acetyl esterase/lipase
VNQPAFLKPLVLPVELRPAERVGEVDLYLPDATGAAPAVVIVHGGPMPAEVRPTPREWPVWRSYASALAARGLVGVMVDHGLHSSAGFAGSADAVAAAVETARKHPAVDADRLAVWAFSGGGLLLSDWLRTPPAWLRAVAASYPMLSAVPGFADDEPRFRPAEAVATAGDLPIVLTRAGLEAAPFAAGVEAFVTAAMATDARLQIIDVPNGRHSFDILDDTDESRDAIEQALDAVTGLLKQ